MSEMKIASNNVINWKDIQKKKDEVEMQEETVISFSIWAAMNDFLEETNNESPIEGAMTLLKTSEGYIMTNAWNFDPDELMGLLEEYKQRHYFNKFIGEISQ
jgi:hypothetical protein